MAKRRPCNLMIEGSRPIAACFFIFSNFMFFKLLISFLRELARSTKFQISIYMSIRSYHININFRLSRALSIILLSKMTKFSPKNCTVLPIKLDMVFPATFQWYHSDPLVSAVLRTSVAQIFWKMISIGLGHFVPRPLFPQKRK